MTAHLFPGFEDHTVKTQHAEIFLRKGGSGPALFLVHGFPQTHVCWHKVATTLSQHFTVILCDNRGYGRSSCPASDDEHYPYSKRAMAQDIIDVADYFGLDDFFLVGHDRGGRISYRLAFDHPGRVKKLAVLDIIPTHAAWSEFSVQHAMKSYHWLFLAQPNPFPEEMILSSGNGYIDYTIASWTKDKNLSAFNPEAMEDYRQYFSKPEYVHANCEDYRAGLTYDDIADKQDLDAGRKISTPMLILWGDTGLARKGTSPMTVWENWADDIRGFPLECGHFLAEEKPEETARALLAFFNE